MPFLKLQDDDQSENHGKLGFQLINTSLATYTFVSLSDEHLLQLAKPQLTDPPVLKVFTIFTQKKLALK